MWTGEKQLPLSSLLFRNIAGRCGRAGLYTEGDTIIYDNPLGNVEFTSPYRRPRQIVEHLIAPRQVAIESPLEALLQTSRPAAVERAQRISSLASQFLAAVLENEGRDNMAGDFYRSLYAGQVDTSGRLRQLVDSIERDLVTDGRMAMAQRASPIVATAFGRSCALTGLSPESCRLIITQLENLQRPADTSPAALLALLLEHVKEMPEVQGPTLSAVYRRRTKFPVKPGDVTDVIRSWLVGHPVEHTFSSLPYARRSTKIPPVDAWLRGLPQPTSWDEDFDHYYDFVSQVLQSLLPWVCRGIEVLKEHCVAPWVRETQ